MGFGDKLGKKITNRVEDNVFRSAERGVDKSMDSRNVKNAADKQKTKSEEKKAAKEEKRAAGSDDKYSDRKQCTGCGFVTTENFCSKCGTNLGDVEYMTQDELDDYINNK